MRAKLKRVRNRGFKLSFIVSVLVGLSIILALIISIGAVYQIEQSSFTERTLELNRINSERLAATTDSLFKSMKQSLALTAGEMGKHLGDQDDIQYQMDLLKSSSNNFNSTTFVDKQGMCVAISPASVGLAGTKLTSDQVAQALNIRKFLISEPYMATTGRLVVNVSHPVFDMNGGFIGIVVGTIYVQADNIFKSILDKEGQDLNESYTYAVSRLGVLIYHPDPSRIGEDVSKNPIVQEIMNGKLSSEQSLVNSKGASMLASEALVAESGWGVVTQTPSKDVLNLTQKAMKRIILYTLPFVLLLLILAWWVSTLVAKPLTQLANYASVFSEGEQHDMEFPQIKHWNYEANKLNKAIIKAVGVLQEKVVHFTQESQTDALTGLMNRRSIDSYMEIWMEQEVPFSVLLLDLDHFKAVNDNFGHLMGDEMLKYLARIMLNEVRPEDVCCRFGGEEFLILLPRVHAELAYKIAERIRMRMEFSENPIRSRVTLSLGIAGFPENGDNPILLLERADRALYQAKQNGRNQIITYNEKMN
ncbi:sensor domain-containing diguanylate cyclase [Paenibacillus psychroresistens]|nr:sensor domain-containing diguanylate cyclase [Paenibacillus psychroresistens]